MEVKPSEQNLEKRINSLESELKNLKKEQQKVVDKLLFQKAKEILEKQLSTIDSILDKDLKTMSYRDWKDYFDEYVNLPDSLHCQTK